MAAKYDKDGNRIGDDGLLMTKARVRLHNLYNFCFFYMIITLVAAIALIAYSYFQGQTYTDWELVAVGGNQYNGLSVATVMRVEALFLLFCTVLCLAGNMKGMGWMYDDMPMGGAKICLQLMAGVSVVYFIGFTAIVGFPDPASAVMAVTGLLGLRFMKQVDVDRKLGRLKKDKAAR